ncbi:MAG: hypothetical protein VCA34_13105 [Roseibacillus sp.]
MEPGHRRAEPERLTRKLLSHRDACPSPKLINLGRRKAEPRKKNKRKVKGVMRIGMLPLLHASATTSPPDA